MSDLDALIRVRKHTVEQKQKFLSELYRQAEELEAQKQTLVDQMVQEREAIKGMPPEMQSYFGPFADAVRERIEDIEQSQATLEGRIEVARDVMREAFAALKKVEVTQERREAEEQAEINAKEGKELDETALEIFRRQQED